MKAAPEKRKPTSAKVGSQEVGKAARNSKADNAIPDLSPQLRWNRANPAARKAHSIVARAVKRGDLVKQPCFICGDPNSEAHHPFNDAPLHVDWLCHRHHRRLHAIWRKVGRRP